MKSIKRILIMFLFLVFIINLKCFATNEEEIIEFNDITTKMPEIICDTKEDPLEEKYLKKNYNSSSRITSKANGVIDNENISDIISKFGNENTSIGIDVSYHQGNIDWKKVSESGVKFAMIRCGFRGYGAKGTLVEDVKFKEYIKGALDNGIKVGVYFYSMALNEEEALQEAKMTVDLIKNYNVTYPVAYDFESFTNRDGYRTNDLSHEQINKNAQVFLKYVKSCGYTGTLYGSTSYLNDIWNMKAFSEYDTWVAHYGVNKPTYNGNYQMWQYTETAVVPGINDNKVDVDIDYYYFKNKTPFRDIKPTSWYYNALEYMYTNKFITGTSASTFSPNDKLSRAMLVTILWNMEGRPKVSGTNKFPDVKNGAWYTDAIIWASTNKVVNGNKDGSFAPNANITRQEVAVMLANYAKYKGKNIESNKNLDSFKDNNKIASWAVPSVKWAIENRIINGAENGTKINPVDNATRAESVTMFKNYIDNIK